MSSILAAIACSGRPGLATWRGGQVGLSSFSPPVRLLYVLPTGGGKTVVLARVMASLAAEGVRSLFLVHRKELVEQTVAHLRNLGVDAGVIMAGFPRSPEKLVQVASVQTLNRRLATEQDGYRLVIVDECHHAVASSYIAILKSFPSASVVGATATPFRLDEKGLWPVFTSILCGPSIADLIESSFLVSANVYTCKAQVDTAGIKALGGDFVVGVLSRSARMITGDVAEEFRKRGSTMRTLVYACDVIHSKELTERFLAAGYSAEHVDGKIGKGERDAIISRFRAGKTQILVNVEIVTEGFDVPDVEAIVLVRPTLSRALYLQMVGRGLRPRPGKTECIVLDHAGNILRHGNPEAKQDWSLVVRPPVKLRHPEPLPERAPWVRPEVVEVEGSLEQVELLGIYSSSGQLLAHPALLVERGHAFQAGQIWEVALTTEPGKSGRGPRLRATCADRSCFPRDEEWSKLWRKDVLSLLLTPQRGEVDRHVDSLLTSCSKFGTEWNARRIFEQWGADEARNLAVDERRLAAIISKGHRMDEKALRSHLLQLHMSTGDADYTELFEKYRKEGARLLRLEAMTESAAAKGDTAAFTIGGVRGHLRWVGGPTGT